MFVLYRFLQNHWTEFDETLHALFTLPDDVKNAKKNFRFHEKNFQKFFKKFRIFTNPNNKIRLSVCVSPPYNSGTLRLILMIICVMYTLWGYQKREKNFRFREKKKDFTIFPDFCRSFNFGDSSVNFKNSKNLLKY